MTVLEIISIGSKKSKIITDENIFSLYKSEIYHMGIREDEEIEGQYLDEIYPILIKRARARVLYILQKAFRSEAEVRSKLKEGFYPDNVIDDAIDYAKSFGYINDMRFAQNYIETYKSRYSRSTIKYKLIQKRIDRELIDELISESEFFEDEQIRELLLRKGYSEDLGFNERSKIIASVMRKGFKYSDIAQIIASEREKNGV